MKTIKEFWAKSKAEFPEFIYLEQKSAWDKNTQLIKLIKDFPEKYKLVILSSFCVGYSSAKMNDLSNSIKESKRGFFK